MRQMDENFDGRISYRELKEHIMRLGFPVDNQGLKGDGAVSLTNEKEI